MDYRVYLQRILESLDRIRTTEVTSTKYLIVFSLIAAFGLLNCVLGYRLLRFWAMLCGFFLGALTGYMFVRRLTLQDKIYYLGAMVGIGIIFAIIAFLIYRVGIFILAAGCIMAAAVYFLRPTSSAMFFLCILVGVAAGVFGLKFSRGVIIFATSLMGGVLAGFSMAKIGHITDLPIAFGMSAGFAFLGMLVQFATNKVPEEEEEEAEEWMEDETPSKKKSSADSVDFRLPGGYDDADDDLDEDFFDNISDRKR